MTAAPQRPEPRPEPNDRSARPAPLAPRTAAPARPPAPEQKQVQYGRCGLVSTRDSASRI